MSFRSGAVAFGFRCSTCLFELRAHVSGVLAVSSGLAVSSLLIGSSVLVVSSLLVVSGVLVRSSPSPTPPGANQRAAIQSTAAGR